MGANGPHRTRIRGTRGGFVNPEDLPCYGHAADFMFNTERDGYAAWRNKKIAKAKLQCSRCPLRQRCLDKELDRMRAGAMTYGIYGQTTQAERRRILRDETGSNSRGPIRGLIPIAHGTHRGYIAHLERKEKTCPACRHAHAAYKRARNEAKRSPEADALEKVRVWLHELKAAALQESWALRRALWAEQQASA